MSKVLEGIEHEDQSERFTPFGKPFPVIRRAKVHSPQVIMDVVPPVTWVNRPSPNAGEALDALGLTSTTIETVLLPDDNRTYQVTFLKDDGSVAYRIDAYPPMTDKEVNELLEYIPRPGENATLSEVLSYAIKSGSVPGFELRHEYFVRHIADCIQWYGFQVVREAK